MQLPILHWSILLTLQQNEKKETLAKMKEIQVIDWEHTSYVEGNTSYSGLLFSVLVITKSHL